jgi:hypothetical protein
MSINLAHAQYVTTVIAPHDLQKGDDGEHGNDAQFLTLDLDHALSLLNVFNFPLSGGYTT